MNRFEMFRDLLVGSEADAVLLTSEVARRYLSNCNISEGMAVVTKDSCLYFTDSRYIEAAVKGMPDLTVRMVDRQHSYTYHLQQVVKEWNVHVLGYEEENVSAGELQRLEGALDVGFLPMQNELSQLRQVKSKEEIDSICEAQEITDTVFTEILDVISAEMTEKQLKAELIYRLYKHGAEAPSFDPVVVSGPNSSMPHGVAGERELQNGDFITLDFGCKIDGYCSDMTRTVALGSATEEMKRIYDTVLAAQMAGIAATRAGRFGSDIDAAARCVIDQAGYGEYFGHGYGHGVGLEIHEEPNCSPSWKKPLPIGCVCSAEPGIYLPGKFGVRIEDMVIVEENGCRNITKSPKSFIIL